MGQQNAKHRDTMVTLNIEAATNYCVEFKKEILLAYTKQLKEFSDEEPKGLVAREHVMATAEIVGISNETCIKMLDHLYTLFDHEGKGWWYTYFVHEVRFLLFLICLL